MDDGRQGRRDHADQEIGKDADKYDHHRQRDERQRFAPVGVEQTTPFSIKWPIENALEHPEQVTGRQDHGEDRDNRYYRPHLVAGGERDVFRHETGQTGQAERCQPREGEECRQQRHLFGYAAKGSDFARVRVIRDNAHTEEEQSSDKAMTEHLYSCAGQSGLAESYTAEARRSRGYAKQYDAHVTDARISDQLLHVRLHKANTRAVENVDSGNDRQPGRELSNAFRQQRETDAYQA